MALDNLTKRNMKAIGHNLKPVVMISTELTKNINTEITRALNDHELIKIQVKTSDREAKKELIDAICKNHGAELVQQIGHVALIFKAAKKPNPKLSNLLRAIA